MLHLGQSIINIKGMGPKTAEVFESHGIRTVEDLLYFFPRAWMNASTVVPIAELRFGMGTLIEVQVAALKEGMSQRTRIPYLRATVADSSGYIDVMWFHAKYLRGKVRVGTKLLLYGQMQGFRQQDRVMMSPKILKEPCIQPVYPTIGGLPSYKSRPIIEQLKDVVETIPDYLPDSIRLEHSLLPLNQTLKSMHFPADITHINLARLRLGFDELLMLMVPSLVAKAERDQERTESLTLDSGKVKTWCDALPFSLTEDQQQVIAEILQDLGKTKPMNRLLQGDVGTGKTVVGLAAALQAILAGKQVAWLAPTELLAKQHFETAKKLFAGHAVGIWTRTHHLLSDGGEDKKVSVEEVTQLPLVIGTHALLSDKVLFRDLGLLIIDEQHRFGVKQRAQLRLFGGHPVHLLSMTATPIPRTMALLLYGDLSLSVIKQKPAGRKEIVTRVVTDASRDKAYQFIDEQIAKGGQVYVVCPLIEPAKDDEANMFTQLFEPIEEKKAVTTWATELQQHFPDRAVAILHGKMKAADKDRVMQSFRSGETDILVSTTVIEVGVDVPNANIMIIEGAERFGLAQLHQLRGRVGRGERQSFCLLFPSSEEKSESERLKIMEQTNDGFVLAEKDLELRGPGELTGLSQSGIPPLRFASLQNTEQVQKVQSIAVELLANPAFKQSLERFWRQHHPE